MNLRETIMSISRESEAFKKINTSDNKNVQENRNSGILSQPDRIHILYISKASILFNEERLETFPL